jgi:DNA-binding GntR family transcriptional regulator
VPLDVSSDAEIDAAFATVRSQWDSLDILVHAVAYAPREAIEGMAARLACRRGGEAFRSTLRVIKKKIVKVNIESDPVLGIAFGRELHRAIMDAAHNGIMADIGERLENLTVLTSNITKRAPRHRKGIRRRPSQYHQRIASAERGKSEQLMREHLRNLPACRGAVLPRHAGDFF